MKSPDVRAGARPLALLPQHRMSPPRSTAHVWNSPADTCDESGEQQSNPTPYHTIHSLHTHTPLPCDPTRNRRTRCSPPNPRHPDALLLQPSASARAGWGRDVLDPAAWGIAMGPMGMGTGNLTWMKSPDLRAGACPKSLLPQHRMSPPRSKAHVW